MADKAKAHILPWVDSILSRMVYFFHYSSWVRLPAPPRAHQSRGRTRPPRDLETTRVESGLDPPGPRRPPERGQDSRLPRALEPTRVESGLDAPGPWRPPERGQDSRLPRAPEPTRVGAGL